MKGGGGEGGKVELNTAYIWEIPSMKNIFLQLFNTGNK